MKIYTLNNRFLKLDGKLMTVPPPPSDEVKIGTQTWKTKNLAIDDGQGGIYTKTVNYGQGNVTEYYYLWDAAVRVASSVSGWHIPSISEWRRLANQVGGISIAGTKLKSTYGWSSGNGTNDYGFTVVPAGIWYNNAFIYLGTRSELWTSDIISENAYYFRFNTSESIDWFSYNKNNYVLSVRLLKD